MNTRTLIPIVAMAVAACGAVIAARSEAPARAGAVVAAQTSRAPIPVWIDTDPSVAPGGKEVDDGFALVQAIQSPELAVRGVSVVFGNAPLAEAVPIARSILASLGRSELEGYEGAAGREDLGKETSASRALAAQLRRGPLRVLVLGPATNVATVIKLHPELASRMIEIVAVAGRRPGQRFTTGTTGAPPHRDLNFELDPDAFAVILRSGVPLVLAPWEISSHVWLRAADLDALAAGGGPAAALVPPARDWLALWTKQFGVDGFNPFDTLAVAYLTSPSLLLCEALPIEIEVLPDDRAPAGSAAPDKPYLIVDPGSPAAVRATYCYRPRPAFKDDLLKRLRPRR